ncbi:MAG TPA: bestrophin family protein [Chitinophagaceae bacterium]|nr:bestrophin family protein [Chitinophagaceae bacterium]
MIAYNPKDWFTFIFRFHKGDTVRRLLPLIFAISAYSLLVAYLELEHWNLSGNIYLRNLSLLHNLLGFVLSLLLVFRTNTAYDRWWEGRKLWGSLVNTSRNLAIKLNAILAREDHDQRLFFKRSIPFYATVLKDHLRSEATRLALDEEAHPELNMLDRNKHLPNQVASQLTHRVYLLHRQGKISGEQLINLNADLQAFTDICGACERIKNTPIPFSYSVFVKKFIFFYVMTLPFGFVFSLGYYVIPVVAFVFYVLASLELIAEEIEDPFGSDSNDLPTEKIAQNIRKHVEEIL